MPISEYRKKRDFSRTPEPAGQVSNEARNRFVVQEHHASRLHFDLRLEMDGVLKSWAVPKGPSMDPADKRLAVQTEDHPLEYLTFEGHIPEGNYGAGDMVVWDSGSYETRGEDAPKRQIEKGQVKLRFHGGKLNGDFALVRMPGEEKKPQWLLIKDHDKWAKPGWTLQTLLPDKKKPSAVSIPGAKDAKIPAVVKPMLASLVDKPFSDEEWLFEVKWDGYRAICFIENGKARLISRNGHDLGPRFPVLAELPAHVDAKTAVLDGELVALDDHGVSRFQLLQPTWKRSGSAGASTVDPRRLVFYAFDLIYRDGRSLVDTPLIERKELLRSILQPAPFFRFSDHVIGQGEALYEQAVTTGLEGIIAKRLSSRYEERRSLEWLKIKRVDSIDVVIGGFTKPRGARKHIGALVVGMYRGSDLIAVGHVGAGSRADDTHAIYERLAPIAIEHSPFRDTPKTNEPAQWVEPKIVAEVKFNEWTKDHQLRQPILLGIREDKDPMACVFEEPKPADIVVAEEDKKQPARPRKQPKSSVPLPNPLAGDDGPNSATITLDGHDVELSNLNKVLWPADNITKRQLLRYYAQVADVILQHLKDRPLVLQRYPNGIEKPSFYQHNVETAPDCVQLFEAQESSGTVCYAVCNNQAALLYLVNLAAIAFNPWHSRIDGIDQPDWIVFDLDPHGAPFRTVLDVALATRAALCDMGMESYAKTSGSSGLHVYVPIERSYDYQQGLAFANSVGAAVERKVPALITRERTVRDRPKGRIYFDCYQNSKGKTIAAPYSARACAGATVSMPVTWAEVEKGARIEDYTISNVPGLVRRDLFAAVLTNHQALPNQRSVKSRSARSKLR